MVRVFNIRNNGFLQTSQLKLLVEQNNLKHKEILDLNEELDQLQRGSKLQIALIDKLKHELDAYKSKNHDLSMDNINLTSELGHN